MYKLLIPLFALALLIGCTPKDTTDISSDPPMPSSSSGVPAGFDGVLLSGKHIVVLETSMGDITLELDADIAPKTVTNFVTLARSGYYDDLIFHRVIPRFMIQGGDPNGNGTGGASVFGEMFEDEFNDLKLTKGVIAMANRGPDTNGSQFFIVQADATPWLDGRHTAFGTVTAGMDVVDAIAEVQRNAQDVPLTPITYTVTVK